MKTLLLVLASYFGYNIVKTIQAVVDLQQAGVIG